MKITQQLISDLSYKIIGSALRFINNWDLVF